MTKAAKLNNFTSTGTHKETARDKTTRIVRVINEDEVRHRKTVRLRKARFESEEDSVAEPATTTSNRSRKRL
jgi:hypothetical protein